MPIVNKGELGESEAQHTESPVTPARRRRGGRRVVRDTGAAGASLKLQVEDHSAPLFEEPKIAAPARSEAAEEQPARRRRRHIGDESASTASSKESAVSYTHLDVYKRQLHPLRGLLRHAANNVAIDKGRRAAPIRGTARRSRHIAFVE